VCGGPHRVAVALVGVVRRAAPDRTQEIIMGIVVVVALIAVVLVLLGVLIEGLLWLLAIAAVLFVAALAVGYVRGRTRRAT
jgi:hypothetical protein